MFFVECRKMSSFVEVVAGSLGIFDPLGKGIGLAGHLVGHRELRDRRVLRAYRDFRQRGRGRGEESPSLGAMKWQQMARP